MSFLLSIPQKNAALDAVTANVTAGSYVQLYAGTVPGTCADTPSSPTVLVALPFEDTPCFQGATGGSATAGAITQTNAAADGIATFYRISTGATAGATVLFQGTVGTTGTNLILNTTSLVTGYPCAITSLVISI